MDGIFSYPYVMENWDFLNLRILEAAMFHGDTSWNLPNMRSSFNRIYFMMAGEAYLENEKGRVPLLPGMMYLVPAGCRYSYVCPSVMQKFYIHFSLELLPGVDLFGHMESVRELPCEPEVLENVLAAVEEKSVSGLLRLKAIFAKIICDFFERDLEGPEYMDSFQGFYRQRKVLDYLAGHLQAGLRLEELADAMGVPVHRLSRGFRQDTGLGLKEYMSQQLAQRARHLLLHTDMTIGEISESLGFSDPYYFSRFFKKYEMLSPREYRRQPF